MSNLLLSLTAFFIFKIVKQSQVNATIKGLEPYIKLPERETFSLALETRDWEVPDTWYVAVTDVVNSTQAIDDGKYKNVNVAGAMPITSIGRAFGSLSFPFVFGGDGMSCLVPPNRIEEIRTILSRTVRDVWNLQGLQLRAACIPLKPIYKKTGPLGISKLKVSDTYRQAVIHGAALHLAELILKKEFNNSRYKSWFIYAAKDNRPGDYRGFSCRWSDIPTDKTYTAALVLRIRNQKHTSEIINHVQSMLQEEGDYHPLTRKHLKVGGKTSNYKLAALFEAQGKKNSLKYLLKMLSEKLIINMIRTVLFLKIPVKISPTFATNPIEQNIRSSDVQKYDGTYKMIFSVSEQMVKRLNDYLESAYKKKLIFFGIHLSKAAHMTCLTHLENGEDVHFIDAEGGGYAMAAKKMKQQVNEEKRNSSKILITKN